ncbi:MAG: hypothetical protein H8E03_00585 [Pelagibacteraceae bacterium]|nr:hypothetical protein [Pelagibacteraceae bacterium]
MKQSMAKELGSIGYDSDTGKQLIKLFLDKYKISYFFDDANNEFGVSDHEIETKGDMKEFVKLINNVVDLDNFYDEEDVTTLAWKYEFQK